MTEGNYPPPPPPPPPPVAPSQPSATFDFIRPFTFVFDDPNWLRKVLLGGLFEIAALFLVGVPFVLGYLAQLARNVVAGQQNPLPEWDDLGAFFGEGLRLFGVALVYTLPILIVEMIVFFPLVVAGQLGGKNAEEAAGVLASCVYCLIFPIILALGLLMPAAMLMSVVSQSFGAAFDFKRIWTFVRSNLANYLLAIVVYLVAQFAASIGFILLCVGVFFTAFLSMVVSAYAFAQVHRLSPVK